MSQRARHAQRHGRSRTLKRPDPSRASVQRAAEQARRELYDIDPQQSAKSPAGALLVAIMAIVTTIAVLGALGFAYFEAAWLALSFAFGLLGLIRACACFIPQNLKQAAKNSPPPQAAPIWTILIALYREADSVPSLLAALSRLEWVPDRLDIIFACEADDAETINVLIAQQSKYDFRIVRVPPGGPRTKPHALQTALPFVRGRFLTVYDAEDRPDPAQLRAAFSAFASGSPRLGVVQAPLVTWNHTESWIARQFALDYAVWFRVMLPAFARFSGLIPLGGTSNHFRTHILRQVGGWDPYNVTEDADLGVRLYRDGYLTELISPPTFEEAPPKVVAWVKQRGRWIQGHIQTFSLHLRDPLRLAREIGWRGLIAFLMGLGTGPMAALIFIPYVLGLLLNMGQADSSLAWASLAFGMLGQFMCAVVACHRDGRWGLLICALTLPAYYCLQSVAACRAMWRVVFTPAIWDKTDHGCAARTQIERGCGAWIGQRHSSFLGQVLHYLPFPRGVPPAR